MVRQTKNNAYCSISIIHKTEHADNKQKLIRVQGQTHLLILTPEYCT